MHIIVCIGSKCQLIFKNFLIIFSYLQDSSNLHVALVHSWTPSSAYKDRTMIIPNIL